MRLLRDVDLQRRIRKFQALRKSEWDSAIHGLLADSTVQFVDANGMVLTHPLAGEPKRSSLLAKEGDLVAQLHERKGRVDTVDVAIIKAGRAEVTQC